MKIRGKAVIIGNGINRVADLRPTWEDIVKDLFHIDRSEQLPLRMLATPFPLLVEEACKPPFSHAGEKAVQTALAEKLAQWRPSMIHEGLLAHRFAHILTTNYDLVLEQASGTSFSEEAPFNRERRYSLFRRNVLAGGTRIWHIHGSIAVPETMVLGFEHYSGYLQALREAVVSGRTYSRRTYGPLKKNLGRWLGTPAESWPEVALTHHLLIIGTGLDFAELGLWWLLTYRARRRNLNSGHLPDSVIIFAALQDDPDPRSPARNAQLKNCGVRVLEVPGTWSDLYAKALAEFAIV